MARGPTNEQITTAIRKGLYKLHDELLERGIESVYVKGTFGTYASLSIGDSNVNAYSAFYRLIRASNGEAALIPSVRFTDGTFKSEFGAFKLIQKTTVPA